MPERAPTATADPERDAEAAVVAAYLAFWEAVEAAGDPPDPDHPDLAAATGDPQLTQLREVLSEYREHGHVRRGDHDHYPVVREILDAQDAAIVDDCLEIDPEAGLYDAETGERLPGCVPTTSQGRRRSASSTR